MTASIVARIILRYFSGLLIAKGLLDTDLGTQLVTDPDVIQYVQLALGAGAGIVAEWWYWFARRFGWSK